MPKGNFDDMPEQGSGGGRGGIWHLRLVNDGERARLRFLTDANEFFYSWFHRLEVNGKYKGDKICVKYEYEQECDLCADKVKSTFLWLAWVYVDYQDFAEPAQGRKPIKSGRRTLYRQEINEARLMKYAGAHKAQVKIRIEQLEDKGQSLLDWTFDWVRAGEKGSTRPSYMLDPVEKVPFPKELADLLAELPDLADVAADENSGHTASGTSSTKEEAPARSTAWDDEIGSSTKDTPFDSEPPAEPTEGGSSDLF